MRVNILGTEYRIEQRKVDEDPLLETRLGYCDNTTKTIVIGELRPELGSSSDMEVARRQIVRHEIVHAFLFESGLDSSSDWGRDETLVDWIALQFPKIKTVFERAECI